MPFFLCVEGVAGDGAVAEVGGVVFEEALTDGEFAVVLFAAVGALGKGLAVVVVAEGHDGAEGVTAAVAEVFSVEGEAFGEEVGVALEPGVEGAAEDGGVEGVQEVVEGVVAGELEAAGFFFALVEADGGALLLVEGSAFSPNAFDVGGAADEAVGDEAEHGA